MKNIINYIKTHKKSFIFGGLALVLVLYFVLGGGESKTEAYTVASADIEQSVVLSGKLMTSDKADLGFAAAGRLSRISVKNNQKVTQGQVLAQLEIGDLLADLKIKQLNSQGSTVDLEDAKENLEKVKTQEDTKVESARRALLTGGLELIPESNSYNVDAPTLGGVYNGPEGQYKIRIKRTSPSLTDITLFTFGLERAERFINEESSTPLGTRGLYISFPDDIDLYDDTTWYIDIPNKSSSEYLENLNTYNEAKDSKDLAVKDAEFEYQKLLTEEGGGDSVAQAEIQKINSEIRKNTIYAPFSGIVTNIEKEVGENASVGERVVSMLGEEKLEVVLQVSELDVSKLVPGSTIKISIDAFPEEVFNGTLKTVNSRETEIEGVPVYEAFVELPSDPRIKTGMSANGTIVLDTRENVLAIPSYLIKTVGDKSFVEVLGADGTKIEKEITVGLKGTDSMVEITSGLSEGETINSSRAANE